MIKSAKQMYKLSQEVVLKDVPEVAIFIYNLMEEAAKKGFTSIVKQVPKNEIYISKRSFFEIAMYFRNMGYFFITGPINEYGFSFEVHWDAEYLC